MREDLEKCIEWATKMASTPLTNLTAPEWEGLLGVLDEAQRNLTSKRELNTSFFDLERELLLRNKQFNDLKTKYDVSLILNKQIDEMKMRLEAHQSQHSLFRNFCEQLMETNAILNKLLEGRK